MDKQQRDAHYFDLLWSKIISNYRKKSEIDNFINNEKDEITIERIARLGHHAYGDCQDDYDRLLASIMQKRIDELQSEKTEILEVRKANYFALLLKIISPQINQDTMKIGMSFLFEDSHASINAYNIACLGSLAYKEHSKLCYQLFAMLLKERFFELIRKSLVPQSSPIETFPRYREELKDCKLEDFAIDSAQRDILSASVSKLSRDGAFSNVTAQKLGDQGINTGLELFKTNREWIRGNCNLDEKELQQIHEHFFNAGLRISLIVKKSKIINATKDFLKTPITDLDLSVRLTGSIKAYNGGRPIEEQYLTAEDIYRTSTKEFIKLRNVNKKQILEITELFAKHNLSWS